LKVNSREEDAPLEQEDAPLHLDGFLEVGVTMHQVDLIEGDASIQALKNEVSSLKVNS